MAASMPKDKTAEETEEMTLPADSKQPRNKSSNGAKDGAREKESAPKTNLEIEQSAAQKKADIDYAALKALDYYHGFVSRGDLTSLVKSEGEFIVRISEVEAKKGKEVKYDLILSTWNPLAAKDAKDAALDQYMTVLDLGKDGKEAKHRNIVIQRRKKSGKYCIEMTKPFDSVKELIDYYLVNSAVINNQKMQIKTPITQQFWEFKHADLNFEGGRKLGAGAYGYVMAGKLDLRRRGGAGIVDVAVKIQKSSVELMGTGVEEKVGKDKIKEQMREARIMSNLNHKNVVRLYGVAVQEQPLYIILELINGGELKSYLIKQRANGTPCSIAEKVQMCRGAARGLEYLHQRGYIHRDIAARNCLYVPDEKLTKISDFGLGRKTLEYKVTKNGSKLPTKWLAPETLEKVVFYAKSDVYSFGVMMFEVFADGDEPWKGVKKPDVRKNIAAGIYLQMPEACPLKLRTFIQTKLYVKEMEKRATATETAQILDEVAAECPTAQSDSHTPGQKKDGFFAKLFGKKKKNDAVEVTYEA